MIALFHKSSGYTIAKFAFLQILYSNVAPLPVLILGLCFRNPSETQQNKEKVTRHLKTDLYVGNPLLTVEERQIFGLRMDDN